MEVTSSPFGSRTRTRALLGLELLGQSYPREMARLLEIPLSVLQKALGSLERDALVVARAIGRTRVFQLNPRFYAIDELRALLARLLEAEEPLKARAAALRRRPRRTGKPL